MSLVVPVSSLTFLSAVVALSRGAAIEAITFDAKPGEVYIPVREAATALGWKMSFDPALELIQLNGITLDPFAPQLSDGTWLISTKQLAHMGGKGVQAKAGAKRVWVDLKAQVLRAWQGERLVYEWPVSSGREGKETPNGTFKAGQKERMHISTLYGSPMPFSVHVTGNIFIHGSTSVGAVPGSHGCIRLQVMDRRNMAEEFYNWISPGTPIRVTGAFLFKKSSG